MKYSIPKAVPIKLLAHIVKHFIIFRSKASPAAKDHSAKKLENKILAFCQMDLAEVISRYKGLSFNPGDKKIPRIIWVFWWQGEDKLNSFVGGCIKRMQQIPDFKVNIITKYNVREYIEIDDAVELYTKGKIYVQTLSDIIRIRLLRKYGGFWCDATILVCDLTYFPSIVEKYQFYSNHIQFFDREHLERYDNIRNISAGKCSSYFWASTSDNPIFAFLDDAFSFFLKKHQGIIDYSQIDYMLEVGYRNLDYMHMAIDAIPYNNQDIWWLDSNLDEPYNEKLMQEKLAENQIFKMSSHTISGLTTKYEGIGFPENSYWKVLERKYIINGARN